MEQVFLYGTLCHAPLRRLVLGADPAVRVARLADHAVVRAGDDGFALLRAQAGAVAEGLLIAADAGMLVRMEYYGAVFGCRRAPVEVTDEAGPVVAQACMVTAAEGPGAPWDPAGWAAREGDLACLVAAEIMEDMAALPASTVARRLDPLRARAQARINARDTAPTALRHHAGQGDVRLLRRSLAYADFFSVEEYDIAFRRFSGETSQPLTRAAFVSGDAITLLPYDPQRDRVLIVEQFRAGPLGRGDAQPWLLEAIAGRIDGGETPEAAALREAREEAGIELSDLRLVTQYYPTPGAKTEYLFGFLGLADLPDGAAGLGGLEGEGEDIRSHVLSFERAMELVGSGEINVGPLILLLLQLARLRPELRAEPAGWNRSLEG